MAENEVEIADHWLAPCDPRPGLGGIARARFEYAAAAID